LYELKYFKLDIRNPYYEYFMAKYRRTIESLSPETQASIAEEIRKITDMATGHEGTFLEVEFPNGLGISTAGKSYKFDFRSIEGTRDSQLFCDLVLRFRAEYLKDTLHYFGWNSLPDREGRNYGWRFYRT
jgi:hypothetical protein